MRKNGFVGAIVLAIIIFGGVILGFSCTSRVPTGYVGVVYNMNGGVDGEVLSQGWHLVAPTKKVTTYSIGLEQSYLTSEEKGDSPNDESFSIPTSDAKAEVTRIEAEAEAQANREIAASLTPNLIEKIKYERWNGELPTVSGSGAIVSIDGVD